MSGGAALVDILGLAEFRKGLIVVLESFLCAGEAYMGLRVCGIQLCGNAKFLHRLLKSTHTVKRTSQALVAKGKVGRQGSQLAKFGNRGRRIQAHESGAEILSSFEIVRIATLDLAIFANCGDQ